MAAERVTRPTTYTIHGPNEFSDGKGWLYGQPIMLTDEDSAGGLIIVIIRGGSAKLDKIIAPSGSSSGVFGTWLDEYLLGACAKNSRGWQ